MAQDICEQVLERITPKPSERKRILSLTRMMQRKVRGVIKDLELDAEVRINGSVAKDTWLSGEADIDIFIRFSPKLPREAFRLILDAIKDRLREYKWIERFAEHPYLETYINEARVNIVPCYRVGAREWISATDRTPFHTKYIKSRLIPRLRDEVRLLKKFMKGSGVYGAEIKVKGFSGYLCELLILHYGSFLNTLRHAQELMRKIIDLEGYYRGKEDDARKMFAGALSIIVDPVDKSRNVAATVSRDCVDKFILASRMFLSRPSLSFFYPPELKPLSVTELSDKMRERGTSLLFIKFSNARAVPDVLWGQLYRSLRAIGNAIKQEGFEVIRSSVWSDERENGVFVFELESHTLPPLKLHMGPPIGSTEVDSFLEKHLRSPSTFSGPWIEKGRLFVEVRRRYVDVAQFLREKLADGGKSIGVADLIAKGIKKSCKILVNEEILDFYSSNVEFAKFLTDFLISRPAWLS